MDAIFVAKEAEAVVPLTTYAALHMEVIFKSCALMRMIPPMDEISPPKLSVMLNFSADEMLTFCPNMDRPSRLARVIALSHALTDEPDVFRETSEIPVSSILIRERPTTISIPFSAFRTIRCFARTWMSPRKKAGSSEALS